MKKILSLQIVLVMIITSAICSFGSGIDVKSELDNTAEYLRTTVSAPWVGSVGGEWTVIGLARSGYEVPDAYYQDYYKRVEEYVVERKGDLHDKKYTEYSRLIVALTAIGMDPTDVGGYNLLTPLADFDKTVWQGINGPVWALIALDSGNYDFPINSEAEVHASREMYVERILASQLDNGGFSLFGGAGDDYGKDSDADPDITGMVLQALAKYQYRDDVKAVTEEALECLSNMQNATGGFNSWGSDNSESCVQVIVALGELGIPLDDERFVKNGNTLVDNLMRFYLPNNGFLHTLDGRGVNMMATEQAFYGLVSVDRQINNKSSLYRMTDPIDIGSISRVSNAGKGLENKNEAVESSPVVYPGKTFADISEHENQFKIEALAARDIISGSGHQDFDPNGTMTRAEFAALITKALSLEVVHEDVFKDVSSDSWYYGFVGTANKYGIVSGSFGGTFDPMGTITKEQASVMLTKAAVLTGVDVEMDNGQTRDMLAQFIDYVEVSDWARSSMAFCYKTGILSQSDMEINPTTNIKRHEIAAMIFKLLEISNLL